MLGHVYLEKSNRGKRCFFLVGNAGGGEGGGRGDRGGSARRAPSGDRAAGAWNVRVQGEQVRLHFPVAARAEVGLPQFVRSPTGSPD